MNTNTRTIHTGLYGDCANEIIRAVSGQLSDGLWENSRGYDKYWTNFDVDRLDDGETVLKVNLNPYSRWGKQYLNNPFLCMSDVEFKRWYASKLKAVMFAEFKDNGTSIAKTAWKRDNTEFTSCYLNYDNIITVADVYCVYDQLLGRNKRSPRPTVERVFGAARNANEIAAAKAKREALEKIDAEGAAAIKELDARKQEALRELEAKFAHERDELYEKFRALREAAKAK